MVKFILSILGFALIVYPIKRFIYPALSWAIENAYMFAFIFVTWIGLYLYDFNLSHLLNDFVTKLLVHDQSAIDWFLTPILAWGGQPISLTSPGGIVIGMLLAILVIKIIQIAWLLIEQIKRAFGDVLLVILWCWYTLTGKKEHSVMLITKEEAKNKVSMYLIIFIVVIISAVSILAPHFITNLIFPVNATDPLIINNASISINDIVLVLP